MAEDNQYTELAQLYGSYGDAELKELAASIGDLTEAGQKALTAEFGRRGLVLPVAAAGAADDADGNPLERFCGECFRGLHL